MVDSADTTVLVVEDEPAVAEAFTMMLEDRYEVETAVDGEEALARVEDADVVLLDRMLPGMSGDEILAEIRERGVDCRVVMVSAVDPDFDIVEMGFDDYVTKPPTESELRGTVAGVLQRADYDERLREYHSLLAKRSVLQDEKGEDELAESEEFEALQERIAETRRALDADNDRLLEDAEFVGAIRDIDDDPDGRAGG